ncbi:hypothetical protein DSLASN_24430 [Desulfoluna limicola]|uniref:Toxin n=1 Tax=Desulfoluna limicola TaxID=2810562 RepID=A0ABM7PHR5_9BACT|nr:type II toxin-antitoxin system RelE/ParE family toxin [Desulfoluna limicola]BCS96811.1 hypothetical protein DSLASN_24430 [Desulfoluna limicola]
MSSFRLTAKALEDFKSMGRHTQKKWGRDQRNTYLAKLNYSFHLLADQPFSGTASDNIREGYRVYHVGRHLIFYRLAPSHIEIIRILHEKMDAQIHLKG